MFNKWAKLILVSTSLAPILGAVAINKISSDQGWQSWSPWVAVAILLVIICWLFMSFAAGTLPSKSINIAGVEQNDKEVVAFLLAYLLPLVSQENMGFNGGWLTGAYILLIIFVVIAHAGAFHFNPLMGLLGYHFYGIKDDEGASYLLISKDELTKPNSEARVVKLATTIYLQVKD